MAKIFSQAQMDEIYAYFKDKMNSLQCIRVPSVKPLSECTTSDFNEIVNAYYNGLLQLKDITDVWKVGDSININLNAMSQQYTGESHAQQTQEFVIVDFATYPLVTEINSKKTALLTMQMKGCMTNGGYLGTTTSNPAWNLSTRRSWCNNTCYNAFETNIKSLIKNVIRQASVGTYSTISTVQDKVFLPNSYEIGANEPVVTGTKLYKYYETKANRIKQYTSTSGSAYTNTYLTCTVGTPNNVWIINSSGDAAAGFYNSGQSMNYGISVAFCV